MAYLKRIKKVCSHTNCEARAVSFVLGEGNYYHGSYCQTHAKIVLDNVRKIEKERRSRATQVFQEGRGKLPD